MSRDVYIMPVNMVKYSSYVSETWFCGGWICTGNNNSGFSNFTLFVHHFFLHSFMQSPVSTILGAASLKKQLTIFLLVWKYNANTNMRLVLLSSPLYPHFPHSHVPFPLFYPILIFLSPLIPFISLLSLMFLLYASSLTAKPHHISLSSKSSSSHSSHVPVSLPPHFSPSVHLCDIFPNPLFPFLNSVFLLECNLTSVPRVRDSV